MSAAEKRVKIWAERTILGDRIEISYLDDFGVRSLVKVHVNESGVNISNTGTLNDAGIEALEDAIALAKILRKPIK